MSIFTKSSIVKTFPAFDLIKRESHPIYDHKNKTSIEVVELVAGETLIFRDKLTQYQIGSVASYALANNKCPIKAYHKAIAEGHDCYWINACATVISLTCRTRTAHIIVDEETIYHFEGRLFKIKPTFNNNLRLVEIK